jgi:hypothetical protein
LQSINIKRKNRKNKYLDLNFIFLIQEIVLRGIGGWPSTSKKVHEVGLSRRGFFGDSDIWVHACNLKKNPKWQNRKHKPNSKKKT